MESPAFHSFRSQRERVLFALARSRPQPPLLIDFKVEIDIYGVLCFYLLKEERNG